MSAPTGWVVAKLDDKGRPTVTGYGFTHRSERAAWRAAIKKAGAEPNAAFVVCALAVVDLAAPEGDPGVAAEMARHRDGGC